MSAQFVWPAIFVVYFLFHTLYRVALGGALGLDEAQILLDGQSFRWGYGPQLPLYAWLQRVVFLVTGTGLFGLALLKNSLLCATVLVIYGLLRTRFPPHLAGFASAAVILQPQISWESMRALTHSVLVSFSAVLCFATLWWIARRPTWAGFIVLGLALAVGGLAKYNFALLPVSVLIAGLSLPQVRSALWDPRLLVSVGLAAILVARPLWWVFSNPDLAFDSVRKFNISEAPDFGMQVAAGLWAVASGALNFLALPIVVCLILLAVYRDRNHHAPAPDLLERLIRRSIIVALALLCLASALTGITQIKDRWLQPVLILAGPVLVLWLLPRMNDVGARRLSQIYAVVAVLIVVALPVHFFRGAAHGAAPFAALVPRILETLPPGGTLLAPQWMAGNIAYLAPDVRVQSASHPADRRGEPGPFVLVWSGDDPAVGAGSLAAQVAGEPGWRLAGQRVLSEPYILDDEEILTISVADVVAPGD